MLPLVCAPDDRPALRFGDRTLTSRELSGAAARLAAELPTGGRVAVWATPALETCVAVTAALLAGLADLVAEQLAPHKRPRRLRVVESLPRNDMGKILKRELRA